MFTLLLKILVILDLTVEIYVVCSNGCATTKKSLQSSKLLRFMDISKKEENIFSIISLQKWDFFS